MRDKAGDMPLKAAALPYVAGTMTQKAVAMPFHAAAMPF
jgi:hypothetical protein